MTRALQAAQRSSDFWFGASFFSLEDSLSLSVIQAVRLIYFAARIIIYSEIRAEFK